MTADGGRIESVLSGNLGNLPPTARLLSGLGRPEALKRALSNGAQNGGDFDFLGRWWVLCWMTSGTL